jgi:hypothetical protein
LGLRVSRCAVPEKLLTDEERPLLADCGAGECPQSGNGFDLIAYGLVSVRCGVR